MTYQQALGMSIATPQANFAWNANSESDLAGYRLYAGHSSGVYNDPASPITFGLITEGSYTLTSSGAWFFALRAFNASGGESGFSNEVSFTV